MRAAFGEGISFRNLFEKRFGSYGSENNILNSDRCIVVINDGVVSDSESCGEF